MGAAIVCGHPEKAVWSPEVGHNDPGKPHGLSIRLARHRGAEEGKSENSHNLYLYERILGQFLDSHRRAGWVRLAEEGGIDLVHGSKVGHIREEHRGLDHMAQVDACLGKHMGNIGERLAGLLLDAALGKFTCGRIDGQLARRKTKPPATMAWL